MEECKSNLQEIVEALDSALKGPNIPLPPLPTALVLAGSKLKQGLSPRKIAKNILARQTEAGVPFGDVDGFDNLSEKMEVIRVEEIVNGLINDAKITTVVPPGTPITATGGNAGGPVVVQGATTKPSRAEGVIQ